MLKKTYLVDSLYPTTGLILDVETHTGTQRRIHLICMVCPYYLLLGICPQSSVFDA